MANPIDREEYVNDLRDEERVRVAGCQAKAGDIAVFLRGWKYKDAPKSNVVCQYVQIVINGRVAQEIDLEQIAFLQWFALPLLRVYLEAEQTEWLVRSVTEYLETARKWRAA